MSVKEKLLTFVSQPKLYVLHEPLAVLPSPPMEPHLFAASAVADDISHSIKTSQ